MNAMIFAAGLGTRLYPLTKNKPKALVEIRGKPFLAHAIENVKEAGATRIVINVHHFSEQIIDYTSNQNWDCEILISDESEELLETGGGLLKARELFEPDQPVLIQNADVLISTGLNDFVGHHLRSNSDATLMVKKRPTTRYLLFDPDMRLCGWKNVKNQETIWARKGYKPDEYGFSGIHILKHSLLYELGEIRPFSIIQAYLELAVEKQINGYCLRETDQWFDLGTVDKLKEADLNFKY